MGQLMLFVIQIKMIIKIKLLPFKVKNIAFTKALHFLRYGEIRTGWIVTLTLESVTWSRSNRSLTPFIITVGDSAKNEFQ